MDTPNTPWFGLTDPIAALTHLVAAVMAAFAIVPLWKRSAGNPARRVSVLVFGFSTLVLFLASGIYHASHGAWRTALQRVDHAAIYVLIAGTFTPVVAHSSTGRLRRWVLIAVWTFAVWGIIAKLAYFGVVPTVLDTIFYLAMGWFGLVPAILILRARRYGLAGWLLLGAACYTFGAFCYMLDWPRIAPGVFGPHEVFHLAVIGGGGSFLAAVLRHVVPRKPQKPERLEDYEARKALAAASEGRDGPSRGP